jgi:arylsulfatase
MNLGGHGGGWSFYLKESIPTFCYNLFGIERTHIRSDQPAPEGEHTIKAEFRYDGGGLGRGGSVILTIDDQTTGSGRIERTEPIGFGYEPTDIGRDILSPVTDDYPDGDTAFTGTLNWIELQSGDDSHDHLIKPADFFRVAMYKQ